MKLFLFVLVSVFVSGLLIIIITNIVKALKVVKDEETEVTAVVSKKHHKDSYVYFNPALKITQNYPEEYNVTITFEDISKTFDDQNLYESVKEGDTIKMILYKAYDKYGKVVMQGLYLH